MNFVLTAAILDSFPHTEYACQKKCTKQLPCSHRCIETCSAECRSDCSCNEGNELTVVEPVQQSNAITPIQIQDIPKSLEAFRQYAEGGHVESDRHLSQLAPLLPSYQGLPGAPAAPNFTAVAATGTADSNITVASNAGNANMGQATASDATAAMQVLRVRDDGKGGIRSLYREIYRPDSNIELLAPSTVAPAGPVASAAATPILAPGSPSIPGIHSQVPRDGSNAPNIPNVKDDGEENLLDL